MDGPRCVTTIVGPANAFDSCCDSPVLEFACHEAVSGWPKRHMGTVCAVVPNHLKVIETGANDAHTFRFVADSEVMEVCAKSGPRETNSIDFN